MVFLPRNTVEKPDMLRIYSYMDESYESSVNLVSFLPVWTEALPTLLERQTFAPDSSPPCQIPLRTKTKKGREAWFGGLPVQTANQTLELKEINEF